VVGKKNKSSTEVSEKSTKKTKVASPKKNKLERAAEKEKLDLISKLAEVQVQLEDSKDASLRDQAEMQNILRRSERDVQNAHKYALDKFVSELLPVVDNLERALKTIDSDNKELKVLGEGVELTLKSFQDALERHNVLSVDPKGEVFNPDLHQAMSILEESSAAPNTVIDVFQKGYTLNGRLVRPAMVVVAKGENQ
tara:strand:+ start:40 stop:627 length:588 start_codon:yes stop_codon:yes gene_type:complete